MNEKFFEDKTERNIEKKRIYDFLNRFVFLVLFQIAFGKLLVRDIITPQSHKSFSITMMLLATNNVIIYVSFLR